MNSQKDHPALSIRRRQPDDQREVIEHRILRYWSYTCAVCGASAPLRIVYRKPPRPGEERITDSLVLCDACYKLVRERIGASAKLNLARPSLAGEEA